MAIIDTPRMGWIWGSNSITEEPLYFENLWENHPNHSSHFQPVEGSIIIDLECSRYRPISSVDSENTQIDFASLGMQEYGQGNYNSWSAGVYTFYCGFVDWNDNPGPLKTSTGNPMVIDDPVGGEVRGNIYMRPYAHGEGWAFTKLAKGIMIYAQKNTGTIFPLVFLDFMLGARKIGDIDSMHPDNGPNYPYSAGIPFRYCAGNDDDEIVPGLLSLTGDIGLGSGGPANFLFETDYVGPLDDGGNALYTFNNPNSEKYGETMSITPAEYTNIQYARGFCNLSPARSTKPFKYFQWPPGVTFENWTNGLRIEDIGKQWRWTCTTQSKGHVWMGGAVLNQNLDPENDSEGPLIASGYSDNFILDSSYGGVNYPTESGRMLEPKNLDRIHKSGYRKWTNFNPKDWIDIIVQDGDQVVAMESLDSHILVFRYMSITVINNSGVPGEESVVDTFPQGVKHKCSVCKTPHGIVFVSEDNIYLYNGQKFLNLSSESLTVRSAYKNLAKSLVEPITTSYDAETYDKYNSFTGQDNRTLNRLMVQSIGYYPKSDKIIILLNARVTDFSGLDTNDEFYSGTTSDFRSFYEKYPAIKTGIQDLFGTIENARDSRKYFMNQVSDILPDNILVYSFKNKIWGYGNKSMAGGSPYSNFVNIGDDLVYFSASAGKLYKWDDKPDIGDVERQLTYCTPYFDFEKPNIKKQLKTVRITFRMRSLTGGPTFLNAYKGRPGIQITAAFNGNDLYVPFGGVKSSKNYRFKVPGSELGNTSYSASRNGWNEVWFGYKGEESSTYEETGVIDADGYLTGVVELKTTPINFTYSDTHLLYKEHKDGVTADDYNNIYQVHNYRKFYSISLRFTTNFDYGSNNYSYRDYYEDNLEILDVSITYRERSIR